MAGDLGLDFGHVFERPVPARFELHGHEPVSGIDGVVLSEGTTRGVAGGLQVSQQRLAHLVAVMGYLGFRLHCRGNRGRLERLEDFRLDGVVHPEPAERDAARLAVVEPTTPAAVARNVMPRSGVAERQLAPATAAAQ